MTYLCKEEIAHVCDISVPTFELYVKKGLLPYASCFTAGHKGKGRLGMWPGGMVIKQIRRIRKYTDKNYTLNKIKEMHGQEKYTKCLYCDGTGKLKYKEIK
jgi:hypothetical protein